MGAWLDVPWPFRLERPPVRTAMAVSAVLDHYRRQAVRVTLAHVQWDGQFQSWWLRPGDITDSHPLLGIATDGRIVDIGTAFYTPSIPQNVGGVITMAILAARGLVAPASFHANQPNGLGEGFVDAVSRLREGDLRPRLLARCTKCGKDAALTYQFNRCTFCLALISPQAYRPLAATEEPPLGGTGATVMIQAS
jgi:hypothetical protein